MIKAVLLDVDGILYDSMPLHAKAWVETFKEFHMRLPEKLVYRVEGMKDKSAAKHMLRELGKNFSDVVAPPIP